MRESCWLLFRPIDIQNESITAYQRPQTAHPRLSRTSTTSASSPYCLAPDYYYNPLTPEQPIAKNATTILINLTSHDTSILAACAADDDFLLILLSRLTSQKDPNADLLCQLLANLCKHDSLSRLLNLKLPPSSLSKSSVALDHLFDLFTSTANPTSNAYLSYAFASLSGSHASIRTHLLTVHPYDSIIPLSKLLPFTEHSSSIRRAGVASTIKNCAFEIQKHDILLDPAQLDILPYILLPLCGPEPLESSSSASAADLEIELLLDLQLLPPDKKRESDHEVIVTHLETMLLLTTTREGRERLRAAGTYLVVRCLHEAVEGERVREGCERVVDLLMRDEEMEGDEGTDGDEDRVVEEVF